MTCLACFDISHDAGFARMRAVDDFAFRAVLQSSIDMGFHQEPPESPALYSEISAAKLARAFARFGDWLNNLSILKDLPHRSNQIFCVSPRPFGARMPGALSKPD
jgi:hypothetical protein